MSKVLRGLAAGYGARKMGGCGCTGLLLSFCSGGCSGTQEFRFFNRNGASGRIGSSGARRIRTILGFGERKQGEIVSGQILTRRQP